MIVSAHQPNYLPGFSVIQKILVSDAIIWVDEVQYSHYSFTARNKLSNGQELIVHLVAETRHGPINRVELVSQQYWRLKMARTLTHHLGEIAAPYAAEIVKPYGLLVGLNAALLRKLLTALNSKADWHWQSQLIGGRPLTSIYDDRLESGKRRQISNQLAAMVAEVGGTVYLSGPSGKKYLDETPFEKLNVEVTYYKHEGPNPCALELLK